MSEMASMTDMSSDAAVLSPSSRAWAPTAEHAVAFKESRRLVPHLRRHPSKAPRPTLSGPRRSLTTRIYLSQRQWFASASPSFSARG